MGTNLTRREVISQLKRSSRIVDETAAFTFTPERHGGRITTLSLLAGFTATLPPAIGSGIKYRVHVGIVRTSNSYIIAVANGNDNMEGSLLMVDTDTATDLCEGFETTSNTSDTVTMNATTTGGLTIGDWMEFVDVAVNVWHVRGVLTGSGDLATPFSAAV